MPDYGIKTGLEYSRRVLIKSKGMINLGLFRAWATEIGLLKYQPGPWTTNTWNQAYSNGHLDYFADISERARYSVLIGYLSYIEEIRQEGVGDILDVGCGNGLLYSRSSHIKRKSWQGIDLSGIAIEHASKIADELKDNSASFSCADMLEDSIFTGRSIFQTIVINEVLNMCDDPDKLLLKCSNLLSTDGRLIISAWRHRGDRQLWKIVQRHFNIVESVDVRTSSSHLAPRGWKLAYLKHLQGNN